MSIDNAGIFLDTPDNAQESLIFSAESQSITLPDGDYIANADMAQSGHDLVLTLESGESIVVEGYFGVATPPLLISENGAVLTPQLVKSFVTHNAYADAGSGVSDESPVGLVKELSGDAKVIHPDGSTETITLGTEIYEGDVIETGADGAVNIVFTDDTEFAVSEDARLAIDEYVFDPSTHEGSSNFSVLRGVFVFTSGLIGLDDPDSVNIETPVGSIGIRGTIIAGKIDGDGGDNQITVVEGAIVVRNGLGETTLSSQFETVKLGGYNVEMTNVGNLDAQSMNTNFGAVSGVSGSLFSAINDTVLDQKTAPSGDAKTQQESQDSKSDAAPAEEAPADTRAEAPAAEPTPQAQPQPQVKSTSGLESKLSGVNEVTTTQPAKAAAKPVTAAPKSAATNDPADNVVTTHDSAKAEPTQFIQKAAGDTPPPTAIDTAPTLPSHVLDLSKLGASAARGLSIHDAGTGIGGSMAAVGDGSLAFTGTDGKIYTYNGTVGSSSVGISGTLTNLNLAAGGDLNADGELDLIVGAPQASGLEAGAGQYGVYDSSSLSNFAAPSTGSVSSDAKLGAHVAMLGDMNGDGYSDYAVSAEGMNTVFIDSGADVIMSAVLNISGLTGYTGTGFGHSISAGGDINNDGYSDLLVGTTDSNVHIISGGSGAYTDSTITVPANVTNFGREVIGGGDVNRDGYGDFIVSSVGAHGEQAHLFNGNASTPALATTFFTSRAGWNVTGAAILGDFNGDGIDDFTLTTSNGNDNDIFVLFGKEAGLGASVDLNFSDLASFNTARGFAMVWNGVGNVETTNAGDVNGDGLNDLAIGAQSNSTVNVLYGHITGNVTSGSGAITATGTGQSIVGSTANDVVDGGAHGGLSISTGAGNDTIKLNTAGVTHKTINGGAGFDTLELSGSSGVLDFSAANGMSIAGIEEITLTDNVTLTLTTADIFSLLQESSNNTLKITASGAGGSFNIDDPVATYGDVSALGFSAGADQNGFDTFSFQGYTVLVDQSLSYAGIIA